MKKRIMLAVLWILVLLGLLFYPINADLIPQWCGFYHWDKIIHCCLFGITGIIIVFCNGFSRSFRSRMLFGLLFGIVLAVGTEAGQSLLPSRTPSIYDLLADLMGLTAGLLFYLLLYSNKKLRSRIML
jgi:VanZ family protein